jgi:hypothetical protein
VFHRAATSGTPVSKREYNTNEQTVATRIKENTMRLFPSPPLHQLRRLWSSRSPLLLFAIKSALAAGISWEIVSTLFGRGAAALAVVSAVIIVQVTSWQTVSKSI